MYQSKEEIIWDYMEGEKKKSSFDEHLRSLRGMSTNSCESQ
jgi:hypothetical protein